MTGMVMLSFLVRLLQLGELGLYCVHHLFGERWSMDVSGYGCVSKLLETEEDNECNDRSKLILSESAGRWFTGS